MPWSLSLWVFFELPTTFELGRERSGVIERQDSLDQVSYRQSFRISDFL
jgi:hypothetical protein